MAMLDLACASRDAVKVHSQLHVQHIQATQKEKKRKVYAFQRS